MKSGLKLSDKSLDESPVMNRYFLVSVSSVRRKWQNLRIFCKMPERSPWQYKEQMEFLKDTLAYAR